MDAGEYILVISIGYNLLAKIFVCATGTGNWILGLN